jgi:hypothetical protein
MIYYSKLSSALDILPSDKRIKNIPTHHCMNARNGKIARLPRPIRDQLNERLDRSERGPQLLDWLNALPEVKAVLRDNFAGAPINKPNLTAWRQGGFQEWLVRRDMCRETRDVPQWADEWGGEFSPAALANDAATILAARLGVLVCKWDGEVDAKFKGKARILNGLCGSIVRLQREMHQANHGNSGQMMKTPHKQDNPLPPNDIAGEKGKNQPCSVKPS